MPNDDLTHNFDLMRLEIEIAWEDDKLLLKTLGVSARVVFLPKEVSADIYHFVDWRASLEVLLELCIVFEADDAASASGSESCPRQTHYTSLSPSCLQTKHSSCLVLIWENNSSGPKNAW